MSDRRGDIAFHQTLGSARADVHSQDLQAYRRGSPYTEEVPATEPTYARPGSSSKLDPYANELAT